MRALFIGLHDTFSRHELGFIASLRNLGDVEVIVLDRDASKVVAEKLKLGSDNGLSDLTLLRIPYRAGIYRIGYIDKLGEAIRDLVESFDVVFATPREPVLLSKSIAKTARLQPLILRLWSVRASKLRDNLKYGAYEDIALFIPSLGSNLLYLSLSDAVIAIDDATYRFVRSTFKPYHSRIHKIYPPYGYIVRDRVDNVLDQVALDLLERIGEYVLGFTILGKSGSYLKFEAKPHAIALYKIARRLRDVNVVVAGSSLDEWKQVFPGVPKPDNLFFVKGFTDKLLPYVYRRARLVVSPISNRNISNRLLEALYHGRPVVTTELAREIHPELIHGEHLYISTWNRIDEDVSRLVRSDQILELLEKGSRKAYNRYFSTRNNAIELKKLLKSIRIS